MIFETMNIHGVIYSPEYPSRLRTIPADGILLILSFFIALTVYVEWPAHAEATSSNNESGSSDNSFDALVEEYIFSPGGSVAIQLVRYSYDQNI